jgi:hypothetical protein
MDLRGDLLRLAAVELERFAAQFAGA